MEGIHRCPHGGPDRHGLLLSGGAHLARLKTYYIVFAIQLETRRVTLAGITAHPNEAWMEQIARNLTDAESGDLQYQRYLLHDRDTKFSTGSD
jgi:hypothetical protein